MHNLHGRVPAGRGDGQAGMSVQVPSQMHSRLVGHQRERKLSGARVQRMIGTRLGFSERTQSSTLRDTFGEALAELIPVIRSDANVSNRLSVLAPSALSLNLMTNTGVRWRCHLEPPDSLSPCTRHIGYFHFLDSGRSFFHIRITPQASLLFPYDGLETFGQRLRRRLALLWDYHRPGNDIGLLSFQSSFHLTVTASATFVSAQSRKKIREF